MLTAPNQKLLEWVRKFRADLTADGTITRIELYHSVDGEMGERLGTFEMADRDDDEDPDDLAQEIWNECEEDASTRPSGSYQRYTVQAFRGDTREPDEQKSFTTSGKLSTALTGNGSEPPTARGELAQSMRERGDLHALVVRLCEATSGSAAIQLEREREENQRLREVGFEYEKLRQQLLDKSLERELARKEADSSSEQMKMLFGMLLQLAPVVLSKIMAPPAPPGATLPLQPAAPVVPAPVAAAASTSEGSAIPVTAPIVQRDRAVEGLLSSVTPTQMQSLLSTFTPEQTEAFLAVYTSFREHPPSGAPRSEPNGSTPHAPGERHVHN